MNYLLVAKAEQIPHMREISKNNQTRRTEIFILVTQGYSFQEENIGYIESNNVI